MAATTTTSQLASIAAMVERLGPLAAKTRGMPIQADEWNALIAVLGDLLALERIQETTEQAALEQRFAPRAHKHIGEIGMESLDAELLTRLADGGVTLATRLALAEAQKQVGALSAEVARLSALTDDQRAQLDAVRGDALERENRLRQFGERFAAVEDMRGLVAALTAQVDGLAEGVKAVLELRDVLRDEQGNPIDVAALAGDVKRLDELRRALLGVDGKLLRMRDVELALRELKDAIGIGGPGGLDTRIDTSVDAAEGRVNAKLDDRAAGIDNRVKAQIDEARAGLDGRLDTAAAGLRQRTDETVAGAEARLNGTLSSRLDSVAATLRSQVLGAAGELVDARITSVRGEFESLIADRVGDAVKAALENLDGRIDQRLEDRLRGFDEQLRAAVRADLEEVARRLEQELAGVRDSAVNQSEERAKAMVGELRDELLRQLVEVDRGATERLLQFRERIEPRVRVIETRLGIGNG